MYQVVLSCNVAPYWTNPEMDTKETTVARSYGDSCRCLTCTGDRTLYALSEKGRDLMLSISDQHFPAVVPPQDDNCMASVRMSNVGLWSLAVHTIWQICNECFKAPRKQAVSQDQHEAHTAPESSW